MIGFSNERVQCMQHACSFMKFQKTAGISFESPGILAAISDSGHPVSLQNACMSALPSEGAARPPRAGFGSMVQFLARRPASQTGECQGLL